VDKSGGQDTGLAVADHGTTGIRITATAYQSDGVTRIGNFTVDLVTLGHDARFAGKFISCLPEGFTEVLDISSSSSFVALTLRSLTNSLGDFLVTTFQIADANQPPPAPLIFLRIAGGGS
jgi:hypothetical protein